MARRISVREIEAGTKAGWVLLAGVGVYVLWRMFRPRGVEVVDILEPAPRADASTPPEPEEAAEPPGIGAGSLVTTLRASILDPTQGARVYRRLLSSMFPATIQVVNQASVPQDAQVEIVADFDEFTGGRRLGVRTRLPIQRVPASSVQRLEVDIDSGNTNALTFEFGQAYASVRVYTNGKLTQGTSFEVW